MVISGTLIEVGNLEDGGRGIALDVAGETVQVTGLSENECRDLAPAYGGKLTITIGPNDSEWRERDR